MLGAIQKINFVLILIMLSGCGARLTTIHDYCLLYEPVRNYLDSELLVIVQIEVNNGVFLDECYD